jgi:ferrous iron transport protein B
MSPSSRVRVALVGQPNCGKSTLFNHLVGYKAHTSNLPGTTVECLRSEALVSGSHLEIIDLPGTYSLAPMDRAEAQTRGYLRSEEIDVVVNVVDASLLSRSLELTLQLLEMGVPVVVCLNMMDEARRKGIDIDVDALSERLGVPVIPTVAVRGTGVPEAMKQAVQAARSGRAPTPIPFSADVEAQIAALADQIGGENARLEAITWLEADPNAKTEPPFNEEIVSLLSKVRSEIKRTRGHLPEDVVSAERHAQAMAVFERVAQVGSPIRSMRDRVDAVLMHPTFGLVALAAILYGLFFFVFKVGTAVEEPLMLWLEQGIDWIGGRVGEERIIFAMIRGLMEGVGGGLGIVLPFLVPFLLGLALLEDVGYLPRAGYLADGLMHRIGLHGKSIIPFILGYGCSIPAVMATRILENERDRFITGMLSTMIPCVARTTIIYGLVGYFLGPHLAFSLYIINIVVLAVVGHLMARRMPRIMPGLVLEIPSYKIPSLRVVAAKIWLRVREFLGYAMPILVLGSIALSVLEYFEVTRYLNAAALPFTWSLGLPIVVGVPLIFGIFRKELALVMLFSAVGGATQLASVLSPGQMFVYALFTVFYIPCIATIPVLRREFGSARTGIILLATTGIALVVGLMARGAWALLS